MLAMINILGLDAFDGKKILDVGCGYAHLASLLSSKLSQLSFSYTGFDPCSDAIEYGQLNAPPGSQLFCSDIQSFIPSEEYNTIFCCGVFTKKATMNDAEMYELLNHFFSLVSKSHAKYVCFNIMSPFCDQRNVDLFYPSYEKIFDLASAIFGYKITDFTLNNAHLRYEMICRFSLDK